MLQQEMPSKEERKYCCVEHMLFNTQYPHDPYLHPHSPGQDEFDPQYYFINFLTENFDIISLLSLIPASPFI